MDFFALQDAARKRTTLLLFYYALAVVLIVAATYAVSMLIFGAYRAKSGQEGPALWNARVFAGAAIGTLGVIGLGTFWRILELRQGGRAVAEMLGGRLVPPDPQSEGERRLRNLVEEMALASGVPVPELFLLEHESEINAFAAGHSGEDMAIGVTRGCVDRLNRDELQGVIAHEFSHILNGDARMNLRLMGVLHGILCLYILGRVLLEFRVRSSRDRNPLPLFGLALMAIGGIGMLCARMIQAAVSRQREFLADASAVQFTRNPQGIAGALKKIGGLGSRMRDPQAESASHLFFANGLKASWFNLMATHPPLEERIRRIEPGFQGEFPCVPDRASEPLEEGWPAAEVTNSDKSFQQTAPNLVPRIRAESVTRRVGQPIPLKYAAGVLETIPTSLRDAAHESFGATALLLGLLLSPEATIRAEQRRLLQAFNTELAGEADRLAGEMARHDLTLRLPLLNLSLPALHTLSAGQWQQVAEVLEQLVAADGQIDLFEFALKRIVVRSMESHLGTQPRGVVQYYSFAPLAHDCALLLSALALLGTHDDDLAALACQQGFSRLPFASLQPLVPRNDCGVLAIDAALTRLAMAVPHIRKVVLEACAETVAHDGLITPEEAELLRAIAESLGCPLPPFVAGI